MICIDISREVLALDPYFGGVDEKQTETSFHSPQIHLPMYRAVQAKQRQSAKESVFEESGHKNTGRGLSLNVAPSPEKKIISFN